MVGVTVETEWEAEKGCTIERLIETQKKRGFFIVLLRTAALPPLFLKSLGYVGFSVGFFGGTAARKKKKRGITNGKPSILPMRGGGDPIEKRKKLNGKRRRKKKIREQKK